MPVERLDEAGGASFGERENADSDQDEHCRHRPGKPRLRHLVEQRIERNAEADHGEPRPHPTSEGALPGHHRAVFGEIGAALRQLPAQGLIVAEAFELIGGLFVGHVTPRP